MNKYSPQLYNVHKYVCDNDDKHKKDFTSFYNIVKCSLTSGFNRAVKTSTFSRQQSTLSILPLLTISTIHALTKDAKNLSEDNWLVKGGHYTGTDRNPLHNVAKLDNIIVAKQTNNSAGERCTTTTRVGKFLDCTIDSMIPEEGLVHIFERDVIAYILLSLTDESNKTNKLFLECKSGKDYFDANSQEQTLLNVAESTTKKSPRKSPKKKINTEPSSSSDMNDEESIPTLRDDVAKIAGQLSTLTDTFLSKTNDIADKRLIEELTQSVLHLAGTTSLGNYETLVELESACLTNSSFETMALPTIAETYITSSTIKSTLTNLSTSNNNMKFELCRVTIPMLIKTMGWRKHTMKFVITEDGYSNNIVNFKTDHIVPLWHTYNGKFVKCPGWINELCNELHHFTRNGWSISLALKNEHDVEPDKNTKLVVLIKKSVVEKYLTDVLDYQSKPRSEKTSESEDENEMDNSVFAKRRQESNRTSNVSRKKKK